jgi:hypothetical protein
MAWQSGFVNEFQDQQATHTTSHLDHFLLLLFISSRLCVCHAAMARTPTKLALTESGCKFAKALVLRAFFSPLTFGLAIKIDQRCRTMEKSVRAARRFHLARDAIPRFFRGVRTF